MTKEEIALNLTIAVINKVPCPSINDELYSTVCDTYNVIYDNIIND